MLLLIKYTLLYGIVLMLVALGGTKNAPRGCAPRGEVNNALHTARARKCAASAHVVLE